MGPRIRWGPKRALPHGYPQNGMVTYLLSHEKNVALALPLLHLYNLIYWTPSL